MSTKPDITFAKFSAPETGLAVVLADDEGKVGAAGLAADPGGILRRAFDASEFKGKAGSVADILAPAGSKLDRLAAVGVGKSGALDEQAWLKVGGAIAALIRKARKVAVIADVPGADVDAAAIATLATGILLRSYAFDRYKTRKDDGTEQPAKVEIVIHCANPAAARKAFAEAAGVVEGVLIARDLVNEPANVLGPVEMAAKAAELESLGVKVEILTEKDMRKLGMAALLGVSQGSERPARLVVMQWQGSKSKAEPLAFVGKGVVFDSGGISIKGAAGMEDMKGDMAGAAAVIGLMHALASRKAKANVVGIIGCVENMLDGKAQRPGDIVTSMSGQTIEVINTDAEGRLVLADALWYCNDRFKPRFMIDLATLTGAVIVALGSHHAGLFSNDDALAANLLSAGISTQERLWRLPLGPEYDKMIDTKNADMKNTGGRHGGSITAAQFLQRFVKETPWAHLDIAGTAIGSPSTEINQSWASGFGVRLLDRLVRDHYED